MSDRSGDGGERPLGLRELAEIESPEVVRAAVRRFRKRTAVQALFLVAAITALLFVPRLFGPSEFLPRRFPGAAGGLVGRILETGPVRAIVLDARRLDEETVGLHVVFTAEGLRPGEELSAQPGFTGRIEVETLETRDVGPGPAGPPQIITDSAGRLVEAWFAFDTDVVRFSVDVAARKETGPAGSRFRPGSPEPDPDTRECAVPLNKFGQCGLYKDEGRLLATVRFDMQSLGVPNEIWRRTDD